MRDGVISKKNYHNHDDGNDKDFIEGVTKKTWFQKLTAVQYFRQMLAILGNFELFGQFWEIWVNSGHLKQFWATLDNFGQIWAFWEIRDDSVFWGKF